MKINGRFLNERIKMVEDQIIRRGITDQHVLEAFKQIPRHLFVPVDCQDQAYTDHALPIGFEQTISQPYIVALMSECLQLKGSEKVLEIGTGSGYQTAILSALTAEVFSVELINELSERAETIIKTLEITNVHFRIGDGSTGWVEHKPYDSIIITAAAPSLPDVIKEQVIIGGKIVAPIGDRWGQSLEVWTRTESEFRIEKILPVVFVPLKGIHGWQD